MNNDNQNQRDEPLDLSSVWQQQKPLTVDLVDIKRQAQQQTRKQRLYILVDLLSLLPVIIFFILDLTLTAIMQTFLYVSFVIAGINMIYFLKLRWVSAFGAIQNTEDYKQTLLKQLGNNAKIARINKHLSWIVVVAMILLITINNWYYEVAIATSLKKLSIATAVMMLCLVPWYIWANKRQARFERELWALKISLEGRSS